MVIVKLIGGLGNQMFQYALGKSLSSRLGTDFKLDLNFLLDRTPRENFTYRDYNLDSFILKEKRATTEETKKYTQPAPTDIFGKLAYKVRQSISPYKYFYEPHYHFTPEVFDLPKDCYLEGYWQSPKYFESVEKELRQDFRFREPLPNHVRTLPQDITNQDSVCIHVRRTDYINNSFHPLCAMDYYTKAIDLMASRIKSPHFYIFSDDPGWCMEHFDLKYPSMVVADRYLGLKFSDDLHLMSMCKHFIIPNSSFSWWAAWLSANQDKVVIAPKTWFGDKNWDSKDLIPETWLRIEN